jgi:hypothetical protein
MCCSCTITLEENVRRRAYTTLRLPAVKMNQQPDRKRRRDDCGGQRFAKKHPDQWSSPDRASISTVDAADRDHTREGLIWARRCFEAACDVIGMKMCDASGHGDVSRYRAMAFHFCFKVVHGPPSGAMGSIAMPGKNALCRPNPRIEVNADVHAGRGAERGELPQKDNGVGENDEATAGRLRPGPQPPS